MNPLSIVFNLQPMSDLTASILKIGVIGKVNVFVLEGAHEALSNTVLGGLATVRHADAHTSSIEHVRVKPGRIRAALVCVKNQWACFGQRHFPGIKAKLLAQGTAQRPVSNRATEGI